MLSSSWLKMKLFEWLNRFWDRAWNVRMWASVNRRKKHALEAFMVADRQEVLFICPHVNAQSFAQTRPFWVGTLAQPWSAAVLSSWFGFNPLLSFLLLLSNSRNASNVFWLASQVTFTLAWSLFCQPNRPVLNMQNCCCWTSMGMVS